MPVQTISDWLEANRGDRMPGPRLARLVQELHRQRTDSSTWILLASLEHVAARVAELQVQAASATDTAALVQALPLYGVPFAVKDNIDVAGWPTTAGCPASSRQAAASANAVLRLQAAGAVCVGKTNLDQFATGLVGTRSPFGRPSSVCSALHVSGGSSSGSAVAVASGQVPFALGTDTAGSGRIPAGFNHIVGLKPTPGRVGTTGVLPACRSLDCVSVFALDVGDAARVLSVIEGADGSDAFSRFVPGPAHWAPRLRIGVPLSPRFGTTSGYAAAWDTALAAVEALGHRAVPVDLSPLHDVAELLYDGPWVAERHAAVAELLASDPGAFDPNVRHVIEAARAYSATDLFRAQYRLRDAQRDTAAVWRTVDVLMVPTAPGHPTFAEVDADPIGVNAGLGHYTNFVNLLGWCALALPCAITREGLPFGVTFVAAGDQDAALAGFGLAWQQHVAQRPGAGASRPVAGADALPIVWPAAARTLPVAVVGAHLSGLPLNHQLTARGAVRSAATHTSPNYRLYALPGTSPPKPGLQRVSSGGASVEVEVWEVPIEAVGGLLAEIPPPLGLGSVELIDGRLVHGFLCEGHALAGARDITSFGGWRAFLRA